MNNLVKISAIMISVIALLGCMTLASEASDASSTVYVGGDGANDFTGDGTEALPYATLSKAIASVGNGGTVILKDDLRITTVVIITNDVNINLNNNEIICQLGSGFYDFAVTSGSVSFSNGTISDTRTVSTTTNDYAVFNVLGADTNLSLNDLTINLTLLNTADRFKDGIRLTDGASATLNDTVIQESGTWDITKGYTSAIYVAGPGEGGEDDPTTLTITGGSKLVSSGQTINCLGNESGDDDARYTLINIQGDTHIESTRMIGIYHPQLGTLNISGNVSIKGPGGIEMRSGTLNVSGNPTVEATEQFNIRTSTDPDIRSGFTMGGVAVAVSQNGNNNPLSINLEGGTFKGDYALYEVDLMEDDEVNEIHVSITGGSFEGSSAPLYSQNVEHIVGGGSFNGDVTDYCEPGFIARLDSSTGKYVTGELTADEGCFEVDGRYYLTLKDAVENIDSKGEVGVLKDFIMNSDEIVTIPEGKDVTLDMNEKTATAASDFSGRYIINNGKLTITGDGTFEDAGSADYRGPVTNNGTLIIENGTFHGNTTGEYALIWNSTGAIATFNGGTYEGAATIINGYIGSKTYINGGSYITPWYPAIDNSGHMEITGGTFVNTSCSACNSPNKWGYTIRNGSSSDDAYLLIKGATDDSVKVTGTQGALSITGGTADIYNGTYTIVDCEKGHGATFYACYIAGESFENSATIYGGTFTGYNKEALHIGNSNPAPDSGVGESSVVNVKGGTFKVTVASEGVNPIKVDEEDNAKGAASITGGTFVGMTTQELEEFLPDGYVVDSNGQIGESADATFVAEINGTRYTSVSEAISKALDRETVHVITEEVTLASTPVLAGRSITISVPEGSVLTLDEDMKLEVSDGSLTLTGGGTVTCTVDGQITIDGGRLTLGSIVLDSDGFYSNKDGTYTAGPTIIWLQSSSSVDVSNYSVLDVSEEATIRYDGAQEDGAYAIAIDYVDGMNTAYGVVVDFDGTIAGNVDVAFYINGNVEGTDGNVPVITIGSNSTTTGTIYAAGYAKWYIHGGQFEGTTALSIKSGYFEIDGGTFHATGAFNDPADANGNGSEETGAALSITTNDDYAGKIEMNVSGGTFISENGYAVYEGIAVFEGKGPAASASSASLDIEGGTFRGNASKGDVAITTAADKKVISGGTFSSDVSAYCAEGFTTMENPDGTYGVTKSVTITFDLPGDTSDETVEIPKGTTIPSDMIPTAPKGYGYEWVVNGDAWNPTSVIEVDITVKGTMCITDVTVSLSVDGGYVKATVKCGVTIDDSRTTYMWAHRAYDNVESITGQGSASYELVGPGLYEVLVTVYDSAGVSGTAEAVLTYSTPDTPEMSYDIEHDGDSATVTVPGDTVIITSSGEHDDIDITLGFTTADIEINGNVGSGAVTVTMKPMTEDRIEVALTDLIPEETVKDDIKGVDVTVSNVDDGYGMWIKVKMDGIIGDGNGEYVASAMAYYIDRDDDIREPVDCYVQGGEVWIYTDHNTEYVVIPTGYSSDKVFEELPSEESDQPVTVPDDDELPPFIPAQPKDDDTVTIVACAAAAVVAALMAVFLILTYRKD